MILPPLDYTEEALEASLNDWLMAVGDDRPATPEEVRRLREVIERHGYDLCDVPFLADPVWDALVEEALS